MVQQKETTWFGGTYDLETVKVDRPMGSYHPKHKDM